MQERTIFVDSRELSCDEESDFEQILLSRQAVLAIHHTPFLGLASTKSDR
jgi:hypothetical protein